MNYKLNVKKKNECVAFKMSFSIHLRLQQMMLLYYEKNIFRFIDQVRYSILFKKFLFFRRLIKC